MLLVAALGGLVEEGAQALLGILLRGQGAVHLYRDQVQGPAAESLRAGVGLGGRCEARIFAVGGGGGAEGEAAVVLDPAPAHRVRRPDAHGDSLLLLLRGPARRRHGGLVERQHCPPMAHGRYGCTRSQRLAARQDPRSGITAADHASEDRGPFWVVQLEIHQIRPILDRGRRRCQRARCRGRRRHRQGNLQTAAEGRRGAEELREA
mmetsp:Transcript_21423/g.54140  ORF Transcript_21423/g.54140 Transcript_21423/m.54140 type:complete len:207 (-) Transcript_21423:2413-3033(-)